MHSLLVTKALSVPFGRKSIRSDARTDERSAMHTTDERRFDFSADGVQVGARLVEGIAADEGHPAERSHRPGIPTAAPPIHA